MHFKKFHEIFVLFPLQEIFSAEIVLGPFLIRDAHFGFINSL